MRLPLFVTLFVTFVSKKSGLTNSFLLQYFYITLAYKSLIYTKDQVAYNITIQILYNHHFDSSFVCFLMSTLVITNKQTNTIIRDTEYPY